MLLYFVRHGEASNDDKYNDSERPLTEAGKRQANVLASFLVRMKVGIDMIVSSPLLRAMQTASIIRGKTGTGNLVPSELLLNGTDQQELFRYLSALGESSVLLVGHIPLLEDTISSITNGESETGIVMKKCSLAIIQTQKPIGCGTGRLKQLLHIDAIENIIKS